MRRIAFLLLFAILACKQAEAPPRHEASMQQTLQSLRTAIAHFRDDNNRGPHSLEELVPRYLPRVPVDPVTGSATSWRLTTEESVQPSADFSSNTAAAPKAQILEIHSGAPGADASGKRWADY